MNKIFIVLALIFGLSGCGEKTTLIDLACKLKITREDGANFQVFDPPLPEVHASFSLRLLETHKRFSSDYLYHYVSSTWEDLESCKPLSGRKDQEGSILLEFTKQNNSWRKLSECRLMGFRISGSNGIPYYADKDKTILRDDRSETLSNFYSYDTAIKKSEYIFNGYTYFDYHNKDYYEGAYYACKDKNRPNNKSL